MTHTNPSDPAFSNACNSGLTIREYFASLALQGMLGVQEMQYSPRDVVAGWAVDYADALIRKLNESR